MQSSQLLLLALLSLLSTSLVDAGRRRGRNRNRDLEKSEGEITEVADVVSPAENEKRKGSEY